ncbi:MAG: TonB-dependent receptor, partial [Bacteroidota bacterium]|nr:TonB-dependent receptor [Bacteroidota bacterium]
MKHLLFLTAIVLFSINASAQVPGGGNFKPGQGMPNLGHVFGKLKDSAGKAIEGASVLVLQNKFDSVTKKTRAVLVKGMLTTNLGEFNFEELPVMGVKIKVSATGFKEMQIPVMFFDPSKMSKGGQQPAAGGAPSMPSFDKDLGNIELKGDAIQLQAITITASTPTLKLDIDKKVFNVDKNIVSMGGTAVDVMRNVPSVQVDIDGNVKLRNASPQIYIDGRPTTLTLDQIPADAIQSVEVITNPSAKYDASGGNAGILNIVLKKNKKSGYNGNVTAGVDSKGGLNGGASFNARQGKINISASTFAHGIHNKATGTTDRVTFGSYPTHVSQENVDKTTGAFVFGRLGIDYFVSNRTTISLAGIKVHGQFRPNSDITTDSLDNNNSTYNFDDRSTRGSRTFNANGLQASAVHNFV